MLDTMSLFSLPSALLALIATFPPAHAQYPPPASYQNVLKSPTNPNITVSYKQPSAGTCTTAFSTQKQYTGYIEIPPFTLAPIQQNYSINTFFWFVEARQTPESAPLTIYLSGGPGTSSMFGLFNEVGPCEVVQLSDGTYGTQMRLWGWDRISNVLFIDQPNQVGFSFDTPTNASYNLYTNDVFEPPTTDSSLPGFMYLNGTFGSASVEDEIPYANTANTTQIAATATWHFLQAWLSTFKQYNPATRPNVTTPNSNEPAGINMFTESYGGKFGPAFAEYFEQQNQGITNGTLPSNSTLAIELLSLGIINGLVDDLIQDQYYPTFAYNNTFGVQAVSQTDELNSLNNYTNQCVPAIQSCRSSSANIYGDVPAVNALCEAAAWTCNNITALATEYGYDPYDIRQKYPSPVPPAAYQEYLNNGSVLEAIGARINYTESNPYVFEGFLATGDSIRGGMVDDIADLLSRNIRVALIYGDADYLCNWYGGEAISYAIANALPNYPAVTTAGAPTYAVGYAAAGYAEIVVNDTYVGGAVKQYGNLSFSRIYDAGHFVPFYQPATAFQVFARVILGNEISTGEPIDLSTYGSTGPANASYTNDDGDGPASSSSAGAAAASPTCWVRSWNASCSSDDTVAMLAGHGLVQDGIYYQDPSSIALPTSSVAAGVPGSPLPAPSSTDGADATFTAADGSMSLLTGVYTATATPSMTKKGAASPAGRRPPLVVGMLVGPLGIVVGGLVLGAMVVL